MAGIAAQTLPSGTYIPPGKTYNPQTGTFEDKNSSDPYTEGMRSSSNAASSLNVAKAQGDVDFNIDPTGQTSYSNTSAQARQTEAMRLAALKDARDSFMSATGGVAGGSAPTVAPPNVQGNEGDARANAFRMAKDQAGKIARSSLTSIAENMASRGISGSGIEALRSAGAVQGADQPLQNLTSQQLTADTNRAADISDMSYTGAITQRGQDLASRSSYLNLLRSLY